MQKYESDMVLMKMKAANSILFLALLICGCVENSRDIRDVISDAGGEFDSRSYTEFGESFVIRHCTVEEGVCEHLVAFPKLRSLTFEECRFSKQATFALARAKDLQILRFVNCDGLSTEAFRDFHAVKRFELQFRSKTLVKHLPRIALVEVRLKNADLEKAAWRDLKANQKLSLLKAVSCKVGENFDLPESIKGVNFTASTGDFMSEVIDCPAKQVIVDKCTLSTADFWRLVTKPQLQGISLRECIVESSNESSGGVAEGQQWANLELDLRGAELPDGLLKELLAHRSIWTLAIDGRDLSPQIVDTLCQHNDESLVQLNLGDFVLTKELASRLTSCSRLKFVYARECESGVILPKRSFKWLQATDSSAWRDDQWR